MKYAVSCIVLILLFPGLSGAESMYITDHLEVAVRSGKGLEYKILAVAGTDDLVEVLGTEGEYAHLRLENGIEGWILKRYLTDAVPKPRIIAGLEKKTRELSSRLSAARDEIEQLKIKEAELVQVSGELEQLKSSCADVIELQNRHARLETTLQDVRSNSKQLEKENIALRKNAYFWGAVTGLGFALFWFVIGMVFQHSRNKRRRSISF